MTKTNDRRPMIQSNCVTVKGIFLAECCYFLTSIFVRISFKVFLYLINAHNCQSYKTICANEFNIVQLFLHIC